MMEIKVQCDCGQKYKFDVEPINGRMPFAVNCPICGLDGTGKANEVLAGVLPVPVPAAIAVPTAAPPPVRPAMRISRPAPAAPAAAPPAFAVAAPAAPGPIAPIGARPSPAGASAQAASGRKPSFGLGLVGALTGAVVGGIVYCALAYFIGFRLILVSRFLAIGVGYLAGLGADLLGRKEGSKELGMLAAVFALAAIFGAQYVNARIWWNAERGPGALKSLYEASVAEARKVVAAVPTGSDQEIRAYLAAEAADSGEKPDLSAVSAEEIKEFREGTLPEMRKLASGQTTQADFEGKTPADSAQNSRDNSSEKFVFTAYFMLLTIRRSNIFAMIAAAAAAFKVGSNA
jgi:hypothetical protein